MSYYIMNESAGAEGRALDGIVMIIGLTLNNVTFRSVLLSATLFRHWIRVILRFLADHER